MGRYPLKSAIRRYMEATKDYYAPKTLMERRNILGTIERDFAKKRQENRELRAEPANWGEREIISVMLAMKERGLSLSSQRQELAILRGLLRFLGNPVLDQLRAKNPHIFPKASSERKPSLTDDHLAKVLRATEGFRGWRGECIRFVLATYAHTGMRLSELRLAEYSDLNLNNWTIRVSHPKGERSYGTPRVIPIPPPLRPIIGRFLREREKVLAKRGLLGTRFLVFPERNPNRPVAKSTIEDWVHEISKKSGVEFTVHSLRRTYGQNLLNRGVSIEAVSIALGHSSTATTERYYCRKDSDLAKLEILRAYEGTETLLSGQTPLIERKTEITGYA